MYYFRRGCVKIQIHNSTTSNKLLDTWQLCEGAQTVINSIKATPAKQDDTICTVSGQHVSVPVKGIYIQNGKKIIIK